LAPALQHYGSALSACLAATLGELKAKLVTTADIWQWRQLQQDGKEEEVVAALQKQLAAAAVNFIMRPLDASFTAKLPQQYVGVIYAAAEGDFECVRQRIEEDLRICSMCAHCLLLQLKHPEQEVRCVVDCAECDMAAGTTCEQCAEAFSSPHPPCLGRAATACATSTTACVQLRW
jgi:hypothetical protein